MIIGTQKVQYHYTKFLASSVHGSLAMNYSEVRLIIANHTRASRPGRLEPPAYCNTGIVATILHDQKH